MSVYGTAPNCGGNNCCVCVPQDQLAVYERCGEYQGQIAPGMKFIGFDCCGQCIRTRVVSNRVTENAVQCESKTSDNVFVQVTIAIQQQPMPDRVREAIYRLRDPNAQIDAYVQSVVRGKVPEMTLDEMFANKDALGSEVSAKLKDKMDDYGWRIMQALVTDVEPDAGVKKAMNAIESAVRARTSAETQAKAAKFVKVKAAEAQAESKALQGQGIARQRAAIVQGLKDSVGGGEGLDPAKVSEMLLITQYFDCLEKMSGNRAQVVFIPQDGGSGEAPSRAGQQQRVRPPPASSARSPAKTGSAPKDPLTIGFSEDE